MKWTISALTGKSSRVHASVVEAEQREAEERMKADALRQKLIERRRMLLEMTVEKALNHDR